MRVFGPRACNRRDATSLLRLPPQRPTVAPSAALGRVMLPVEQSAERATTVLAVAYIAACICSCSYAASIADADQQRLSVPPQSRGRATQSGVALIHADSTPPTGRVFNVYAFGAVGDGKANDTAAIQQAIDASVTSGEAGAVVWSRECVAVLFVD